MFVVVIAVDGVPVAVMHVVDVIVVPDGLMPAARAVLMLGNGVLGVDVGAGHAGSFCSDGDEPSPPDRDETGSWTWANASATTWATCRSAR